MALALTLAGCAGTNPDRTASWSPNKILTEARDEMATGSFDRAIPLWEKLEGRAGGTPLAQQAQLEKAYAQYKNNEPAQAVSTLDRFIKLHPTSSAIDYALYLKGTANFNDRMGFLANVAQQDLSERDQKAAKESFETYNELIARFPQSRYAPDAKLRMAYIVNSLAMYEVHVARYYYNRAAYVAAISRAQAALQDYKNTPAQEEALYLLYKSYDALGMSSLRDDAHRVLVLNYPKSAFLGSAGARPWWKFW